MSCIKQCIGNKNGYFLVQFHYIYNPKKVPFSFTNLFYDNPHYQLKWRKRSDLNGW